VRGMVLRSVEAQVREARRLAFGSIKHRLSLEVKRQPRGFASTSSIYRC
jgi:hypothetical protein